MRLDSNLHQDVLLKNVKTIENEYEISCICYEIKGDNHNESMETETMDIVKLMPKMITQIFQKHTT